MRHPTPEEIERDAQQRNGTTDTLPRPSVYPDRRLLKPEHRPLFDTWIECVKATDKAKVREDRTRYAHVEAELAWTVCQRQEEDALVALREAVRG